MHIHTSPKIPKMGWREGLSCEVLAAKPIDLRPTRRRELSQADL